MVLPEMLHARVVRPNRSFSKLVSLDDALPGVTVVRDGSFVGRAGGARRRRDQGRGEAEAQRPRGATGRACPTTIHGWLKEHVAERHPAKEQSDPAAKARAKKTLKAEYRKQFIAHASIGPSCAIARMQGGKLEVWSHTQGIYGLRKDLSKVLSMPKPTSLLRTPKAPAATATTAPTTWRSMRRCSRAPRTAGRCRLQWMRDDEFAWEPYGTAMAVEMEAGLDAEGRIVSWRHDLFSNGHTHRPGRAEKVTLTAAAHLAQPMPIADRGRSRRCPRAAPTATPSRLRLPRHCT